MGKKEKAKLAMFRRRGKIMGKKQKAKLAMFR
jgi:hypothetical protein